MTTPNEIEFVNDWSELEAAVAAIREDLHHPGTCDNSLCQTCRGWYSKELSVFAEYVPRLLTQYANLVELSFALTEGWEQYASLQGPTGLYLPDHR